MNKHPAKAQFSHYKQHTFNCTKFSHKVRKVIRLIKILLKRKEKEFHSYICRQIKLSSFSEE